MLACLADLVDDAHRIRVEWRLSSTLNADGYGVNIPRHAEKVHNRDEVPLPDFGKRRRRRERRG